MTQNNKNKIFNLILFTVTMFFSYACFSMDDEHAKNDDEHKGHDHSSQQHNDNDDDDDDEHGDFDKSAQDLFATNCEHDTKAYKCDECRYEVGVVKAPSKLFEQGLLKTAKAEKKQVSTPLILTGEVQFDERHVTHIGTQAEGIISKVFIMLGDEVSKGQPLLELKSVMIGEAEADYLEKRGLLKLAKRSFDRIKSLKDESIASEKEFLLSKQNLDTAQIKTNAALGKLLRLGILPKYARSLTLAKSKGKLVLSAPAAGTVLEMHAVPGEVAHSATSLVSIGNNADVWVWADLYERELAIVKHAQNNKPLVAHIKVKAFPKQLFKGVVDFISPAMNESSQTVKLRIAVSNIDKNLLAGMFADVEIFLPSDELTLTISQSAIVEDEEQSFVFVHYKEDYYVRRKVIIGRKFESSAEIKQGISGDEVVVTEGAFLLKSDVLRSKMGAGCAH